MQNVCFCLEIEFILSHAIRCKKNRYRTHRFAIQVISLFRVKFNVEFTRYTANFSIVFFKSIYDHYLETLYNIYLLS